MAKPKPFQRPSIDLDRYRRVWREIYPEDIEDGDNVRDFGVVEDVIPTAGAVRVMFINGRVRDFDLNERLMTFTKPGE